MNKQQTIELLQKQMPSFYSLEQVISIINDIEDTVTVKAEFNDELIDTVVDRIVDLGTDSIDSYELEMYNNQVEIQSLDLDADVVKRAIKSVLDNQ
jgi:hypothetical protein